MNPLSRHIALFLSIATLIQSAALLQIARTHSAIGTFIFMGLGQSEKVSTIVDLGAALILCFLSVLLIFLSRSDNTRALKVVALAISFWMILVSLTTFLNGGQFGAKFSLFAYFARIGLPLAVVGFHAQSTRLVPFLKIVIGVTFITHGIEALTGHPGFIDYVFTGMQTIFGVQLSEPQSVNILKAVGVMDILCGLLLFTTQSKKLILWMALWGLVTASLRIFGFGVQNWGELAIRVSHFALPFALYYHWRQLDVGKVISIHNQLNADLSLSSKQVS